MTTQENDFSIYEDPITHSQDALTAFGAYSPMNPRDIARGFPLADEEEYMWHYLFGVGKPFINFLVFVDVGVGYTITPVFEDKERGQEAKTLLEDWLTLIDYQTTLMQYATYRESLGRGCIVLTKTRAGNEFYYDQKLGVTGVDVINPMSLEEEQLKRAVLDRKQEEPYHQVYEDLDEKEHTILFESDRVIYSTKNPYMKKAVTGISSLAPAIGDLRVAAMYPFHRQRISQKISSLNRHFQIDTDKLSKMKQGASILSSKHKTSEYMNRMYHLINQQQQSGGDIVTLDFIDSKESSFAGKIPDISEMEKGTMEMIGTKMEVPIHMFTFGSDVNRATLEMLSDVFLRRRETGAQRHYIRVSQDICNEFLAMNGYEDGYIRFGFHPFLPEDLLGMYDRIGSFIQRIPETMSYTEIRRKVGLPDDIEYGPADEQIQDAVSDLFPGTRSDDIGLEHIDPKIDEEAGKKAIQDKIKRLYQAKLDVKHK